MPRTVNSTTVVSFVAIVFVLAFCNNIQGIAGFTTTTVAAATFGGSSSSSSSSSKTTSLSSTSGLTSQRFNRRNTASIATKEKTRRPRIATLLQANMKDSEDDKKNYDIMVVQEVDDDSSFGWLITLIIPLLFVYISNQWSRSSLYYLVDFSSGDKQPDPFYAMNVALNFSEAQYGLLASVAFTTLFAIASLGAGIASDRYNRKTLTIVSAVGWSIATLGTSLSTSYEQVVFCRIVMGLACAFSTPTAYTLIQQKVPKDRIALATSLYGTGVAFGGALAALSILLDKELGWQQAMFVISIFGFGSATLSALLLPDDPKDSTASSDETVITTTSTTIATSDDESATPFMDDVFEAFATTRVKWLYLGSFLRFCSGLCIGVWSAPYFRLAFPDNASDYAVAQAFITAIAGSASGLIGGATADWLTENAKNGGHGGDAATTDINNDDADPIGRRLWVPVVGSVLAAPAWYFAIHETDSFQIAMAWLALEYLVAECWFGPTISTMQATVGSKIGGTAQGLFTLTGAVANLAPTLLGFLYSQAAGVDVSSSSSSQLVELLSAGVCFGYISSAACFALSAQSPPPSSATGSIKAKQA